MEIGIAPIVQSELPYPPSILLQQQEEYRAYQGIIDKLQCGFGWRIIGISITWVILIQILFLISDPTDYDQCYNSMADVDRVKILISVLTFHFSMAQIWIIHKFVKKPIITVENAIEIEKVITEARDWECKYFNMFYVTYLIAFMVLHRYQMAPNCRTYRFGSGNLIQAIACILMPIWLIQFIIALYFSYEEDGISPSLELSSLPPDSSESEIQAYIYVSPSRQSRTYQQLKELRIAQFIEEQVLSVFYEPIFPEQKIEQLCGICMLEFKELEKIKLLQCQDAESEGHFFHRKCINLWFLKKMVCPICRFDFTDQFDTMEKKTEEELKADQEKFLKNYDEVKKKIETRQIKLEKEITDRKNLDSLKIDLENPEILIRKSKI